jgi:cytochrome c
MKRFLAITAVSLAAGGLAGLALAQSGPDVLKTKGCLNCHDFEKKKVGPAFKDVAAKNQGKADALVAKVSGAKGHPKVNATEAEVKAAVDTVLSTK